MNKKQKKTLARIVLAAVLVVTLGLLPIRGSGWPCICSPIW